MAPAAAATGASFRDVSPPAEKKTLGQDGPHELAHHPGRADDADGQGQLRLFF
jgi:hypothetical protein